MKLKVPYNVEFPDILIGNLFLSTASQIKFKLIIAVSLELPFIIFPAIVALTKSG